MQLCDIFEDTDATMEALDEMLFQKHLKKLSKLPNWKKDEVAEILRKQDFSLHDLIRIFEGDEEI